MPWCRRLAGILVLTALVGALAEPACAGSATDRIREFFVTVNHIITDPADERRADERLAALRPIVMEMIDFRTAARNALGAEWARRTTAQQAEFVTLFSDLLQTSVFGSVGGRARIDNGLTVTYVGELPDQDGVTVATTVLARRGSEIAVGYRMTSHEGRWMVHDVAIDGVSLVENYAAQFHKVIQRSSYAGLVGEMRARLVELGRGTALASVPMPAMPVVTDAPVAVGRSLPLPDETPAPAAHPTLARDTIAQAAETAIPPVAGTPRPASSPMPIFVGTVRVVDAPSVAAVPVETPSAVASVPDARRIEASDRADTRSAVTTHAAEAVPTAATRAPQAVPVAAPRATQAVAATATRAQGGTSVAPARPTASVTAARAADGALAAAHRAADGALVASLRATDGASAAGLRAADGAAVAASRAADGVLVAATRAMSGASATGTRAADVASITAGRAGKALEVSTPIVVAAGPAGVTSTSSRSASTAAVDTASRAKSRTDERHAVVETYPAARTVYWVQVGAFRTDEAAISVVSALGDEPVSLLQLPDAPLLRVLVGPFQTHQAAVTKLRAIRARGFDAFVAELGP